MTSARHDYIPRSDPEFSAWVNHCFTSIWTFYEDRGLDNKPLITLRDALDLWNADYPAHIAARAAAEAARETKDARRELVERLLRPIAAFVQAYPDTTNAERAAIGITVRRAPARGAPAPLPDAAPLLRIDIPARLSHTLRLINARDAGASGRARGGKPRGTLGAEVWVRIAGSPATEPAAPVIASADAASTGAPPGPFAYLTLSTRPVLRTDFPQNLAGKTAVYITRWVGTRGDKGPWSEPTSATIAA